MIIFFAIIKLLRMLKARTRGDDVHSKINYIQMTSVIFFWPRICCFFTMWNIMYILCLFYFRIQKFKFLFEVIKRKLFLWTFRKLPVRLIALINFDQILIFFSLKFFVFPYFLNNKLNSNLVNLKITNYNKL